MEVVLSALVICRPSVRGGVPIGPVGAYAACRICYKLLISCPSWFSLLPSALSTPPAPSPSSGLSYFGHTFHCSLSLPPLHPHSPPRPVLVQQAPIVQPLRGYIQIRSIFDEGFFDTVKGSASCSGHSAQLPDRNAINLSHCGEISGLGRFDVRQSPPLLRSTSPGSHPFRVGQNQPTWILFRSPSSGESSINSTLTDFDNPHLTPPTQKKERTLRQLGRSRFSEVSRVSISEAQKNGPKTKTHADQSPESGCPVLGKHEQWVCNVLDSYQSHC